VDKSGAWRISVLPMPRRLLVLAIAVLGVAAMAAPASASPEGAGVFDQFGTAPALAPGLPGGYEASNVGASKQPGEPDHANNRGGRSIWFTWTPDQSGMVAINTIGSNFDTLLAVYRGRTVQSLTLVRQNDDRNHAHTESRVAFHAVAGQKYRIAVDGYRVTPGSDPAQSGGVVLNLRRISS